MVSGLGGQVQKAGRAGGLLSACGAARGSRGRRVGFTLMEMMVAIGAVALIAVGVATVFQTVGQTISGGRRISALSQAAAAIEQQMRRDFAQMTRDGFLVIRNQATTTPNGQQLAVQLWPEDGSPRVRRVDEIMFFAYGEFVTAREPINPNMVARSDTARIYYGHGLRQAERRYDPSDAIDTERRWPETDSLNTRRDAGNRPLATWFGEEPASALDPRNPNQFASDWALIRHATLLAQPAQTRQAFPSTGWIAPLDSFVGSNDPLSRIRDKESQIDLQPAASHLFRSVMRVMYDGASVGDAESRHVRWDGSPPRFSSGLVDIATTDLADLRSVVHTMNVPPSAIRTRDDWLNALRPGARQLDNQFFAANDPELLRMHEWMRDALPTNSDMGSSAGPDDPAGERIRWEPSPPDYMGVLLENRRSLDDVEQASRRADQLMLTSSVLVTRCTDFIVEWTFGEVDTDDLDRDGDRRELVWYGSSVLTQPNRPDSPITFTQYRTERYTPFPHVRGANGHKVKPKLLYGSQQLPAADRTQTVAFGQVDPTYRPPSDAAAPPSLPWAWPRAVRVTMGLVDSQDTSAEERFQWVFDLPRTPDP